MTSVERKEYQQTQVYRSVSPSRNIRRSNQNLSEFDNNLDNLLEDLQSSVSRPGSSSANHYQTTRTVNNLDTNRSNSLSRVTQVKPSNPVTEYSSDDTYSYTSPDGTKSVKTYKKESYSYKTAGDTGYRSHNGTNQLDSLLNDLEQVKHGSSAFEKETYNNFGSDPGYQDKVTKHSVQRELHYGDTPRSNSRTRTLERVEREGSSSREYFSGSEGTYGDIKSSIRHRTPSPTPSKTSTLSKQTKVTNVHEYPVQVVETTSPEIDPDVLAHLDPNLLPSGNTKVTTTIKTYTYEIPGSTDAVDSEKYTYAANQSGSLPSKSFVYSKDSKSSRYEDESRWNREEKYFSESDSVVEKAYQKPAAPGGQKIIKETITTRNYQPGYSPEPQRVKQPTYVYNETVTTKNYNQANGYQEHPPVVNRTLVTKQTQTLEREHPPRDQSVIYNIESQMTNKYSPGERVYQRDVEVFDAKRPPYPGSGSPSKPVNISYQYQSSKSTSNSYKGAYQPDEAEPLLQPRPFPTSDADGPPKRVEDLMATIGHEPPNSPYNAAFNAHEAELVHQKKVEALKHQHEDELQKSEPKHVQSTKNITGPPVYYPPGHEMFAKKEESGGWRAEGAMGKESGKYKYEAEAKSKSKSSSGAAIVPVCLPLCCGLPCTIL